MKELPAFLELPFTCALVGLLILCMGVLAWCVKELILDIVNTVRDYRSLTVSDEQEEVTST